MRDKQLTFSFKHPDDLFCTMCKQEKHFEQFHVNNASSRGRLTRCKECVAKVCKERYDKDKTYHQEYYKKNKEKIIKYQTEYNKDYKKEYRKREHVRIYRAQAKRMRKLLGNVGKKKALKTTQYLGCSVYELMSYLEKKFQEGMTWENYGYEGWHIDHIRPC